jgi:hypothetical protein
LNYYAYAEMSVITSEDICPVPGGFHPALHHLGSSKSSAAICDAVEIFSYAGDHKLGIISVFSAAHVQTLGIGVIEEIVAHHITAMITRQISQSGLLYQGREIMAGEQVSRVQADWLYYWNIVHKGL